MTNIILSFIIGALFGCFITALMVAGSERRRKSDWIPCSDKLPEIGGSYIVSGIIKEQGRKELDHFVDVASNYGDYIDNYWDTFHDWNEGQEIHITAWRPLPAPWGGEKK